MTERERQAYADLLAVCRRLRAPDGCPWDREQTLTSMTPYITEEAVESAEAIGSGDADHIAEELGDLAFLVMFCLELLRDERKIEPADVLERAASKLIRRHPHVYGTAEIKDGDAAYRQWQEIKRAEKGAAAASAAAALGGAASSTSGLPKFESLLGEQPKGLPALVAAYRIQEKAGAVGFDWPESSGALAKVREEIGEVEGAMNGDTTPELAREIGDLLFASVNLARHLRVDPERELRAALGRFRERFHHIERRLAERGATPSQASLEEMDALWEEAKSLARERAKGEVPKP
ncbi:MAG: nucleoside triphosphate pyrophosphohydrolase [Candidatus Eiseniibacteriota bacterium]